MKGEINRLYSCADDFYALEGNFVMFLTPGAAAAVCRSAAERGWVIGRVEGGVWHPGFESRVDCIWDGIWPPPPVSFAQAKINNQLAAEFIESMSIEHSAFILTSAPIAG
jgi:hypothetical protein